MLMRFCWVRNASFTNAPAINATTMAGTSAISCSRGWIRCRKLPAFFSVRRLVAIMDDPFHGADQVAVFPTPRQLAGGSAGEHHDHPITDGLLLQLIRDQKHRGAGLRDGLEQDALGGDVDAGGGTNQHERARI